MQPTFWEGIQQQPSYCHTTPINSYVSWGFRFVSISLFQAAPSDKWHNRFARQAAKVLAAIGCVLNTGLAIGEGGIALGVGSLATFVHIVTGARSEFLQRHTIKCLSYSLQCFINVFLGLYIGLKRPFVPYHTVNAFYEQAAYLSAGVSCQFLAGLLFDKVAGRQSPENQVSPVFLRTGYMLAQQLPRSLKSLWLGLRLDGVFIGNQMNFHSVQQFFEVYPQHISTIQQFSFDYTRLTQRQYRQELVRLVIDLLRDYLGVSIQNGQEGGEVVLNQVQAQDSAYQDQLQNHIKEGIRELYRDPIFLACLGEDAEQGREAMEGFYPEVYIPIAHYCQLKEIESPITCPEVFANRGLAEYNGRREKLETARQFLMSLSPASKQILIQKLLKGADYEIRGQGVSQEEEERIREIYIMMTALAGSLHQGNLLSQTIIDTNNPNSMITSRNFFQKAYQEAMVELGQ